MPLQRERYPENWEQISLEVREKAGDKCQRCGVANKAVIARSVDGDCWYDTVQDCYFAYPSGAPLAEDYEDELREKVTVVVLTVAHVGLNKHDKMDCSNLLALCQACHLAEDAAEHQANRRKTIMARKAAGSLFEEAAV